MARERATKQLKYDAFSHHWHHWGPAAKGNSPYTYSHCDNMSHLMTKLTKWLCAEQGQISLGICPVWSESLLCAQWVAKYPSFLHADSKDSNQAGQVPRLIWVFAGCTCHFVGFVMFSFISLQFPVHMNCVVLYNKWATQQWRTVIVHM